MPFTNNRQFKTQPRLLVAARGMYYTSTDGRQILDGTAGLWCVNAGHCHPKIVEAVQRQVAELDFAPTFRMGHPGPFALAERLVQFFPGEFDHVFYSNSGSEAVETALKMAIAYHQIRGDSQRTQLIGRMRGYHGVGFGGISVGGIPANRQLFGQLLPGSDHLPHTHDLAHNAFSRGQPAWGAHLADELEALVARHGADMLAAVIVEPVAGSTGVLIPPVGYLERLRAICDRHGILLIFDEVITAFGRLGASSASEYFGIQPDLITLAKGLTNATVPMGAVLTRRGIYDAFMTAAAEGSIELPHGYTYSGHPLACAAAIATLAVYEEEGLFARVRDFALHWQERVHALRGLPHVVDLRNLGAIAGIELAPRPEQPGARGSDCLQRCFERGLLVRVTGDIVALSPPLIISRDEIDQLFDTLADVLRLLP
ncbi:MAG: aspartate aminotransferase family protein [Spirulinaceae cyanobacterium RM2_2_10]|nr:aspartate aminotransferase family protein [Spirulinaceae cyanobacterium SM2_1_0]NJO19623.1 aspartate aminotransferase family protein [Spirulinaceae cyanobacterium RM2_2_10]